MSPPGPPEAPPSADARLDSWKDVAAYLKRSVRTVQRWERQEGLPVHRHLHSKQGTIYAYASELDAWWSERRPALEHETEIEDGSPEDAPNTPAAAGKRKIAPRLVIAAVALLAAVAAVYVYVPAPPPASRGPTRIAVLPFASLSPAPSIEHLRVALQDEVVTILSYNAAIALRPLSMTRRYEGGDPQAAGRKLNVDKVITGHYVGGDGRLGVTLEAIDVASSQVVWRGSIRAPSADLIPLRGQLSAQLRAGLIPALGLSDAASDLRPPANPEAYALYLKARGAPTDEQPTRDSIVMLERAVALDPAFAPAWAELSRRYYFVASYAKGERDRRATELALSSARRALDLDPELDHAGRFLIILNAENGRVAAAVRDARELVRRRPRSADAQVALGYALRYAGRLEESAQACAVASSLDPYGFLRTCAITFMYLGKYARAHQFASLDEGSEWANGMHGAVWLRERGRGEVGALLRPMAEPRRFFLDVAYGCVDRGLRNNEAAEGEARAVTMEPESMYIAAGVMAYCGEDTRALRLLRKVVEANYAVHPVIDTDPVFADLRNHPEFGELRAAAIRRQEAVLKDLAP